MNDVDFLSRDTADFDQSSVQNIYLNSSELYTSLVQSRYDVYFTWSTRRFYFIYLYSVYIINMYILQYFII